MRIFIFLLMLTWTSNVKCQTLTFAKDCPQIGTQAAFEERRFMGTWFEIERSFFIHQVGMKCVQADYCQYRSNGTIRVHYSGQSMTNNEPNIADVSEYGYGIPQNGVDYTQLLVTMGEDAPPGEQKILATDYESYAVIWSCKNSQFGHYQTAWILGRSTQIDPNVISQIHSQMTLLGINLKMEKTDHNCPLLQRPPQNPVCEEYPQEEPPFGGLSMRSANPEERMEINTNNTNVENANGTDSQNGTGYQSGAEITPVSNVAVTTTGPIVTAGSAAPAPAVVTGTVTQTAAPQAAAEVTTTVPTQAEATSAPPATVPTTAAVTSAPLATPTTVPTTAVVTQSLAPGEASPQTVASVNREAQTSAPVVTEAAANVVEEETVEQNESASNQTTIEEDVDVGPTLNQTNVDQNRSGNENTNEVTTVPTTTVSTTTVSPTTEATEEMTESEMRSQPGEDKDVKVIHSKPEKKKKKHHHKVIVFSNGKAKVIHGKGKKYKHHKHHKHHKKHGHGHGHHHHHGMQMSSHKHGMAQSLPGMSQSIGPNGQMQMSMSRSANATKNDDD